jgi:hypothetical protein
MKKILVVAMMLTGCVSAEDCKLVCGASGVLFFDNGREMCVCKPEPTVCVEARK